MQMQEGVVGDLAMVNSTHRAKSRVDGRTRSDVTSRLPLTEPKAWRAQIGEYSHELRTGLKALQALLLEQLYPRLLHALPPERPPLWPKEKLQFACYTTGAFYRRHPDTMPRRETGASAREYTVIYYPNRAAWPPEDGGMLKLWLPPREEAERRSSRRRFWSRRQATGSSSSRVLSTTRCCTITLLWSAVRSLSGFGMCTIREVCVRHVRLYHLCE